MRLTGVIHMHSTHSYDGKLSLKELKEQLVAAGLSFACMTEHTDTLTPGSAEAFVTECRALSDSEFVFVPGFEVPYKDAHLLMLGGHEFKGAVADAAQLRAWREAAPLVVLAHPVRNAFTLDAVMEEVIDGVEIWNQQYEGKRVPRIRSYRLLESLRKKRPELLAFGGLDLHRAEHLTYPRVALNVESLTEAAILETLAGGSFTFGTDSCTVGATDPWPGADRFAVRAASVSSIGIINAGKFINRTLAHAGLTFPKALKRVIRKRV